MKNRLKTLISGGLGLVIALGIAGCLPFPLGDPAKSKVDRAHLIKAAKFVSDMQTDFFGGAGENLRRWSLIQLR